MTVTEYKKKLWTYRKRRSDHYKSWKNLTRTIRNIEAALYQREMREKKAAQKVEFLINCVDDFFSVSIKSNSKDSEHRLARFVYYKIGIELQLRQNLLCKAVNRNHKAASYGRTKLTNSFKTNPENKEAFHNFKNYYKIKSK